MKKNRTAEELAGREARTIGWRVRDLMHRDYWVFVGDGFDGVEHAPPPMTHADAERLKALGHENYKPRLVRVLRKRPAAVVAALKNQLDIAHTQLDIERASRRGAENAEAVLCDQRDHLRLAIRTGGAMLRGVAAELAESDEERAAILARGLGHAEVIAGERDSARIEASRLRKSADELASIIAKETFAAGIGDVMTPAERVHVVCARLRDAEVKCRAAEDGADAADRATWRVKYNAARVELSGQSGTIATLRDDLARAEALLKRDPAVIEAATNYCAVRETGGVNPAWTAWEAYRVAIAAEAAKPPAPTTSDVLIQPPVSSPTTIHDSKDWRRKFNVRSDGGRVHVWQNYEDNGGRDDYRICVMESVDAIAFGLAMVDAGIAIGNALNSPPFIFGRTCVWIASRPNDGGEIQRVRFFVGGDEPVIDGSVGDVKWRVELKGAKAAVPCAADVSDEALARASYEPRRCAFGGPPWNGLVEMERKSLLATAKGFRAMFEALYGANGGEK